MVNTFDCSDLMTVEFNRMIYSDIAPDQIIQEIAELKGNKVKNGTLEFFISRNHPCIDNTNKWLKKVSEFKKCIQGKASLPDTFLNQDEAMVTTIQGLNEYTQCFESYLEPDTDRIENALNHQIFSDVIKKKLDIIRQKLIGSSFLSRLNQTEQNNFIADFFEEIANQDSNYELWHQIEGGAIFGVLPGIFISWYIGIWVIPFDVTPLYIFRGMLLGAVVGGAIGYAYYCLNSNNAETQFENAVKSWSR